MSWPGPARRAHLDFCAIEGWTEVRRATEKRGGHHLTFELSLPDGRTLRTRISHPPATQTYGARLWAHILRDQLDVDEPTFWKCVRDQVPPPRSEPSPPRRGIPVDLYRLLTGPARLPEATVRSMCRNKAIRAAQEHWSSDG